MKFVDLFQEPGGRSKGCAVVEYDTPAEAHAAIRDLHDTELMGRMMFVREDREEVSWGDSGARCVIFARLLRYVQETGSVAFRRVRGCRSFEAMP